MNMSIQTKLLALCIGLMLVTTVGTSITYYTLTRQDKQRESRQRIQIAFDIILKDMEKRINTYTARVDEFLKENVILLQATYTYSLDDSEQGTILFLFDHFAAVSEELKTFGRVALADRVMLYGGNKRLLVVYQRTEEQEVKGGYLVSAGEGGKYLLMDDPRVQSEITFRKNNLNINVKGGPLPDTPLPPGVKAEFTGEIPETVSIRLFTENQQLGIRIVAPIYRRNAPIGILVGEVFYTQAMVEEYALLSKTEVNFFAENQLSIGTLPGQTRLESQVLDHLIACEQLLAKDANIAIRPFFLNDQAYYQGQCAFKDAQRTVGALTVSLSQQFEKQEIGKMLKAVLVISGIGLSIAVGFSFLFSRTTIRSIQNIVSVIVAAAAGDLRTTAVALSRDEIGMLASKLNQMIAQLRTISGQVQQASYKVDANADAILQQMETLIQWMEQQSTSVDNTTLAIEKINQFIDAVAQNTNDLLAAADQILSSIQETQASIKEVTMSTSALTTNLHLISSSVEQVNQTVKHVSENTGQLANIAQQTETEIHHIDQSFREVSQNADQTQQLAKDTMNAALSGQVSVAASIEGMTELKDVVTNIAQIIREVNSWGEQVSSILGIVDEITEQTSLLSLNASIISAQAGVHGRGFAVVADEIKELAVRTKDSTKEIGTLVRKLQMKTEDGVKHTEEGIKKAEQGMSLANAVKDALSTILERATHSSTRAADTAKVIQQTAASTQNIRASMGKVTDMVAQIRKALQEEEHDIEQVVAAVENISGMAEQVSRASLEQQHAADQIAESMEDAIEKFGSIANQTGELKHSSHQMVEAMHIIESTTEKTLQNAVEISNETVKNLVQQSDLLQKIVGVFKIN